MKNKTFPAINSKGEVVELSLAYMYGPEEQVSWKNEIFERNKTIFKYDTEEKTVRVFVYVSIGYKGDADKYIKDHAAFFGSYGERGSIS